MNVLLAFVILLCSVLPLFLINAQTVPLLLAAIAVVLVVFRAGISRMGPWALLVAVGVVWVVVLVVYEVTGLREVLVVFEVAAVVLAVILLIASWESMGLPARIFGSAFSMILIAVCAFGLAVWINPNVIASRWMEKNIDEATESKVVREDGSSQIIDVRYGSEYPNSFLDIYLTSEADATTAPTLVYVHGGGYVFGDKLFGDPTGNANGGFYVYLQRYLSAGYNIVSVNYAHPPEHLYPTPVLQLAQAMEFLKRENRWGLAMDNVSFACGSAGGNITGMYVLAQSDENYAQEIGIDRIFSSGEIRSVAFNCAVFDNTRMGDTQNPVMDFGGDVCARSYFGTNDLKASQEVAQSNLLTQVTASMPPCYVDDGTEYTYDDQAVAFAARLDELGVSHELHIYPGEVHSFDTTDSDSAQDSLTRQIAFMDGYAR